MSLMRFGLIGFRGLGFRFRRVFAFQVPVLPSEFLYTACCVHNLLDACKERMALGANLHPDVFLSRPDVINCPARAGYCGLAVFRMNTGLHVYHLARYEKWPQKVSF